MNKVLQLLVLSLSVFSYSQESVDTTKPNILFLLADDLGIECLSSYGGQDHSTPNIDQLAKDGIQFNNCFSNPFCSPSRASLLTGRYPFKNGLKDVLWGKHQAQTYLSPDQPSFARQLKKAGYATAISGKWHMSLLHKHNTIEEFGFDQYQVWQIFDKKGKKTRRFWSPHINQNGKILTERVKNQYGPDLHVDFLKKFIESSAKSQQPFLAYFSTALPHFPWEPTPDTPTTENSDYRKPHNEHKGKPEYFPGMVKYLDKCIGQLLQTLKDQGIYENTIVIFLADNGTDRDLTNNWQGDKHLKGGKGTMTDRGTHVPLIVRWPFKIKAGTSNHDLIDFSDFLPTLCFLTGAQLPKDLIHGTNFAPQLFGQKGTPRNWVHVQHQNKRHLRDNQYILTNEGKIRRTVQVWEMPAKSNKKKPTKQEQSSRKKLESVFLELDKKRVNK
ncbi:MAG: sulfatase-like hydrolase/transferase [Lentisphaeraceae bacterium]|nr:sulfatase-like hydrolase/transferase [Lentisphaeraceae bacterium]